MTEEPEPRQAKPIYKRWWFIVLAALIGVLVVAALVDGDDEDPADTTIAAGATTIVPETTVAEATSTTLATTASTTVPATPMSTSTTTSTTPTTSTTTTTTTTTVPTTTTDPGPESVFDDGTWIVGDEIPPGVYQTRREVSSCYWERLSGLGGSLDEIIANANVVGQGIVEIQEGDEAFSASGCGDWIELTMLDEPLTSFGDGWWAVTDHIAPGRYRSAGGELCYWERLAGFSGEFSDIVSNDIGEGQALVEISSSDVGFHTQDCGTFEQIG